MRAAGSPVSAAVPLATTWPIISRSPPATAPGSGAGAIRSSGAPVTSRGARTLPLSTAAATVAIPSGEKVTRPWPIALAARSAWPLGAGTLASNAVSPRWGVRPSP